MTKIDDQIDDQIGMEPGGLRFQKSCRPLDEIFRRNQNQKTLQHHVPAVKAMQCTALY